MPRGRVIYPGFWSDRNMVGLTPFARLFYIGLWNFALCDKGHIEDDPFELKLKILPADPVDPDELLQELMGRNRVVRITVEGKPYLSVPTLEKHSSSDARFKTRCPVCIHGQTHVSPSEPSGAHPFTEKPTKGGEGKGVGVEREGRHQFCDAHPNGTDEPCRACGNARRAYDAATKAEKLKPTPTPPRASDYCPEHDWLLRSQCTEMEHS